jgi:hypothetical protein
MASVAYLKRKQVARCEMFRRMRNAKERKRLERVKDLPVRTTPHGRLIWTITLHNRETGKLCVLDLRISQKRVNSFDVTVDGKPWKNCMNASRIGAAIRKKIIPPHWMLYE